MPGSRKRSWTTRDVAEANGRAWRRRRARRGRPPRQGHERPDGLARTAHAKRALATQFREHTHRSRLSCHRARCRSRDAVQTCLLLDRGDGIRGSFGDFRRPRDRVPARRSVRSRTSGRSRISPVPRWSNAAWKPSASIRFDSPFRTRPSAGRRTRVTSASTPARRSMRPRVRASCAHARIRASPKRRAQRCSSASRPMTSGRRSNRLSPASAPTRMPGRGAGAQSGARPGLACSGRCATRIVSRPSAARTSAR